MQFPSAKFRSLSATILAFMISLSTLGPTLGAGSLQDCKPLADRLGAENVWFGHISGISSTSPTHSWSDMSCFATERECRRWLLRSFSNPGKTNSAMSCRQGAPRWSIR